MPFIPSKKKSWRNCKLYLILDTQVADYSQLLILAKKAILGGVDIIQLRDKYGSAYDILKFSKKINQLTKNKIPYIINDRADLAYESHSSGVHLGQEDMSVSYARKILGQKSIIGVSCQNLAHAKKAVLAGADYIGFGSIFKTQTKPNRKPMDLKILAKVHKQINIPIFAIGGINENNFSQIKAHGVNRIAVCRIISESADPQNKTFILKQKLSSSLT